MLTSYTLRRQAEEARDRADSSVARAPDPAPAVAPDPAPARVPTVDELLAQLEAARARIAELEALVAVSPVADSAPVIESPPADDSAAPRRRR
jgi:hypothetical protein